MFRMERQKLFRDDIRDLADLSTRRMDVYHVVGTLLLAFVLSLFSGQVMLNNQHPVASALISLFYVSCVSAAGLALTSVSDSVAHKR